MKRSLIPFLILGLAVSGCGQIRSFMGGAPQSEAPARAAVSLAEPAPGQPQVAPGPARGWRETLRRDIPYVNMTPHALPVYAEARNGALAGSLPPGEGGYVETCSDAAPVCKIRYGANGATGWVRMDQMGGIAN